ncbi:MAG: hypothetical protein AAFQ87_07295, partial [Bacteroidota bacterium]
MKYRWIMTFLLSLGVLPAFAGLSFNKALISPMSTTSSLESTSESKLSQESHWDDYWGTEYDDFRYSRRLRRFYNNASVDVYWSYYDP